MNEAIVRTGRKGRAPCLQVVPVFHCQYIESLLVAGMYGTFPYFLGKTIAEMPFSILFPIVFSAIAYWMMSFQARADKFFLFIVAIIATGQSAEGIVLCVGSVASSEPVAMVRFGFNVKLFNSPSFRACGNQPP